MPAGTGMRLATRAQLVTAIPPKDYNGVASTDVYVSLKNCTHACIIIETGAWAGGTAAVTLLQATAVANTGSKALSFTTVYKNTAAVTASALVETAVVSDTFTLGTANAMYVIEVDAASLDVANSFDCLCVHVATPGTNADLYHATMILTNDRYSGKLMPDALVD